MIPIWEIPEYTINNPYAVTACQSGPLYHLLSFPPPLPLSAAVGKSRPASMDLLLLHSRCSQTDLRPSHGRQLPQIPTSPQGSAQGEGGETGGEGGGGGGGGGAGGGEARDHMYTEVGLRNNPTPTHCLDDGLYESVGIREGDAGPKVPSAPPPTSANSPAIIRAAQSPPAHANGARNGNGQGNVCLYPLIQNLHYAFKSSASHGKNWIHPVNPRHMFYTCLLRKLSPADAVMRLI